MPPLVECQRVGGEQAPCVDDAVEVDTCVERLTIDITSRNAVAERSGASDAAIRIEVAELGRLNETNGAPIECATSRELVTTRLAEVAACDLCGEAAVLLIRLRSVDEAVALL